MWPSTCAYSQLIIKRAYRLSWQFHYIKSNLSALYAMAQSLG